MVRSPQQLAFALGRERLLALMAGTNHRSETSKAEDG